MEHRISRKANKFLRRKPLQMLLFSTTCWPFGNLPRRFAVYNKIGCRCCEFAAINRHIGDVWSKSELISSAISLRLNEKKKTERQKSKETEKVNLSSANRFISERRETRWNPFGARQTQRETQFDLYRFQRCRDTHFCLRALTSVSN